MSTETTKVRMQLVPGKANPAPPVGSILGQRGVNIMNFCKDFNDKTKDMDQSMKVTVVITIKKDKSFSLEVKLPTVSALIKKNSSIAKGSKEPGKLKAGTIAMAKVREIAELKMNDMNVFHDDKNSAIKMVSGTARSMGIEVIDCD